MCNKDYHSDAETNQPRMRSSVELPPMQYHRNQDSIPPFQSPRPRELLPSMLARSPPGRSSTLPPIQRNNKPARPRKSSITQNSRRPKHERTKSKEHAWRMSIEGRKAFSAEPQSAATAMGKRWEDLIEAATSANEADSDRDLTPVGFARRGTAYLHNLLTGIRSHNHHPSSERPSHPFRHLSTILITTKPLPYNTPSPRPRPTTSLSPFPRSSPPSNHNSPVKISTCHPQGSRIPIRAPLSRSPSKFIARDATAPAS